MSRTGPTAGCCTGLSATSLSATVHPESSNEGWASGASAVKRQPVSAGSETAGGPETDPANAPPASGTTSTADPLKVTPRKDWGAASTTSGLPDAACDRSPDHAEVPVAPPN